MVTMNYDYNTQRKRMALPEYGRNVQKMVDHIKDYRGQSREKTVLPGL